MPRFFATIPDSGPEIQNHCMETPEISRIYALIPKFRLEIKNRCTESPTEPLASPAPRWEMSKR